MAKALDRLPHDVCGTKKGLVVFAPEKEGDPVRGYCFACDKLVTDPYGEKRFVDDLPKPVEKTEEDIQRELLEVGTYPTVSLPKRKLGSKTLEHFGVRVGLSEVDGKTPREVYWPGTKEGKITGYKVKILDDDGSTKYTFSLGDMKDTDFIGWEQAKESGANRLIITEGEEDMASVKKVFEMFGPKEDGRLKYPIAVVSLPRGASSARSSLQKHAKEIRSIFNDVILCFDNDDAGQEAVKQSTLVMPEAKSIILPYKDANECIVKGVERKLYNMLSFKAETPKKSKIIFGEELHEKSREPARFGELTWPWKTLNELTRGIRLGETVYIGGGVKMGKSEVVNSLGAHFIKEHGAKVFMAKPEESNSKTYKLLAGKIVSRVFTDPKVEFDYEAYDRAGKILNGKVGILNIYQHVGWQSLRQDIITAAEWGAKAVFIDPITNLTNGINAAEANTVLQNIAQDISAMALDLNIVAFLFCHLKAPEGNLSEDARLNKYKNEQYIGLGNCPHEMGGSVYSTQFAGSRAMMRSCNYMIGIEGNKDENLPENIRNIRNLKLLEDREFGEVGSVPLYWSRETTQFSEI